MRERYRPKSILPDNRQDNFEGKRHIQRTVLRDYRLATKFVWVIDVAPMFQPSFLIIHIEGQAFI